MAKRVSVIKHDTEVVQGEGSFVTMTALKVSEVRVLRKMSKSEAKDSDGFDEGLALIAAHVIDWDWVDDNGNELPLPAVDPSVMDLLTHQEADVLSDLLTGDAESKNSESK